MFLSEVWVVQRTTRTNLVKIDVRFMLVKRIYRLTVLDATIWCWFPLKRRQKAFALYI